MAEPRRDGLPAVTNDIVSAPASDILTGIAASGIAVGRDLRARWR